ncbi:MAG: glycosyl hydrolase, partial [Kiritimatiellales bacterium]
MNIENDFKNPGAEWRGKPFWAWNGKLEKAELLRQIGVMKEMGFGGFFMHSRTGMETEYLGDEWFDLINACADEAEKLGLEAWLYDEDRWPSGLAGGIVSQHPEFRQKAILLDLSYKTDLSDQVVGQWVAKLDGAVCTELEPFTGTVPAGKTLLTFRVIEQGRSGFYNGFTYIDTMNRDATEAFLKSTHERYAAKCGGRLGKSIKGIFTDEPHRGALLDGFSMYMPNGEYTVPYTQKLFDEFQARFGYDLKEKLPELFLQVEGRRISQVKWHYVELLQRLFLENFAVPCKAWCEEHNLILTGHVLHEDNLTAQTAMSGSMMRYYEHMTFPGVDVLGEHNRNYWIVKQLASAARQTGQTRLLSELYGCTGWQMPFAGHKAVGDWQALLGINLRCHHLSWYTMRGEAKRDYPASILHQSAWYQEYKHIEDYFSRFGLMMAQGEPVCDLLVINPVETFWAQFHLGWSKGLGLQDEHLKTLEAKYQTLFTWLLESQIDFDYGDEEMMSRLASVEGDTLRVGRASYKTVLISGAKTIRSSTLKLLEQFVAAGGKVVVAGEAPTHVDG